MPPDRSDGSASDSSRQYALGYFLPKGRAAASFSQRLVRCPTVERPEILVEARAQIAGKSVPDYARLYRIDARAGFLAKRSTELFLYGDGTIKSINATVEGQGSAVIVSAAKLASFLVPLARGGPPITRGPLAAPPPLRTSCRQTVAALVARRDALAEHIGGLETKFAGDGVFSQQEADELSHQRDRLAEIDDALTLASDPAIVDPSSSAPVSLAALDYGQWFDRIDPRDRAGLPGDDGVLVRWTVNAAARDALTAAAYVKPDRVDSLSTDPAAVLYYRRPVPVAISVTPCTRNPDKRQGETLDRGAGLKCIADDSPAAAPLAVDASASFPQLSGLFRLPIGRGGLFGSREVAAEFDEAGTPVKLKYGSNPGAADIAAALDGAREAGTTLRDGPKDALARKAAILQLRKDIRDLEDALDD